jgi:hypothetical protein
MSSLRAHDARGWQRAENLCRVGDPRALVELLRSRKTIPQIQREFLADLLAGAVKIDSDRKGRQRLTKAQRAHIVAALRNEQQDRSAILQATDSIAIRLGVDVGEIRAVVTEFRRELIERLAYHFGVTPATIESMPRRIQQR